MEFDDMDDSCNANIMSDQKKNELSLPKLETNQLSKEMKDFKRLMPTTVKEQKQKLQLSFQDVIAERGDESIIETQSSQGSARSQTSQPDGKEGYRNKISKISKITNDTNKKYEKEKREMEHKKKSIEIATKGKQDSLKVDKLRQKLISSQNAGVFTSNLTAKAESVKHEQRKSRILDQINKQKKELEEKKKRLSQQKEAQEEKKDDTAQSD